MNPTLYQICFEKHQLDQVKSPMVPFDNIENLRPELREYHSFKRIIDENNASKLYGVFGPRFQEKLRYDGQDIYDFIVANPDQKGVYIFNHARIQSVIFLNVWEQGEYFHPGIKKIMLYALDKNGYDHTVIDSIMTEKHMCFCSYFVTSDIVWRDYMHFVETIKITLDRLPDELNVIYHGSANYSRDKSLGMFPFIVERLFSTYMKLFTFDNFGLNVYVRPYDYSLYTTASDFINYFQTLHRLKEASIDDSDSFDSWQYLRNDTLLKYPHLLHLD